MYFPNGSMQDINNLKAAHLSFLGAQTNLHYGGISTNEKGEYSSILYIIDSLSRQDAADFVEQDPYFSVAFQVKIENFIQKIPKLI